MKKIITIMFCVGFCVAISLPAGSVELSVEAVQANKVPASYATVKDGNIVFGKSPILYCPESFNLIMAAYQLAAKVVIMASEPKAEPKAAPKAEEPIVILASEPKVEEKVMVAAAEPKIIILAFEDVHFDFDKSTLTPKAQTILKRNVQLLKENPKAQIRIAGYTSASGTEAYNQKLSERRANAVQKYLINEGVITRDRLSTIGYGETNPAMYEAAPKELYSKEAKANMRVLFEILVQ